MGFKNPERETERIFEVADFNNDGLDDILMDYADTLMAPIFLTSSGGWDLF